MVQEPPIAEKDFIFLMQTKNKNLERLLAYSIKDNNIRLKLVDNSTELNDPGQAGQIIAFIIGSDVEDPIQSAQRFHGLKKNAKIILLSASKNVESLKDAIRFSPFIGTDVTCLDESKQEELEAKLDKILQNSQLAEKYRDIIAAANSEISSQSSSQKAAFNQTFISKLMDIAPIGIVIVSKKGGILGWNKEAALIFRKSEAQVLGTQLTIYFDPEEGRKLEDFLKQSAGWGTSGSTGSISLERELQGSVKQYLSFTSAAFMYSRNGRKAFILAIKDDTERRQAEKALKEINVTLEERVEERTASLLSYQDQLRSLASKLSKAEEQERHRLATELHDHLGQMLAVSKMKIDLLKKDQLPDETAAEIEEIKQVMDEALVYTRDLMSDLKPPPSLDKEDVRATLEWLAKKMKKHDLNVIVEDDGQPMQASEEIRTILLQCVREVLYNIIKHTRVEEAYLSMSRAGNQVQVLVEDKGKGFNPEARLDSDENGGFGLFNIRERMDLLGGQVKIDSRPGKGTTVKLMAPLKKLKGMDIPAESDADYPVPAAAEPGKKIKVMLVDDHQMMREGLKKIVEAEDDLTVVAEAPDGKAAIEIARKAMPDIIVMDVDMPRMNGIDATREIMASMPDVRVIGLSLHDHEKVVESMKSVGASVFLSKNEAFEVLCATIRSEARIMKKGSS